MREPQGGGRRVGYLQSLEVSGQSRALAKKYRLEKLQSWGVKARIAQLKVKRPTLKEAAALSSSDGNVFKFCNNILAAHRTGAFGGKPALWDFLKDVAAKSKSF